MAEYHRAVLWGCSADDVGVIDPDTLPLSESLRNDLIAWADTYHDALNWESPLDSTPWTDEQSLEFENCGKQLWSRLQDELGPEYDVVYFSELEQRMIETLEKPL